MEVQTYSANELDLANTFTKSDPQETCIGMSIFVKLATKDTK
jgi:hypothetical protein